MGGGTMRAAGLHFPDDLHYLVEHQVWARLESDGTATVGITAGASAPEVLVDPIRTVDGDGVITVLEVFVQ